MTPSKPRARHRHDWQPLSFVFETQLLDERGRVQIRQPDIDQGRVYLICMGCRQHTYVITEWAGFYLGGPGEARCKAHVGARTRDRRRT